jgi:hypothetical protein
MIFRTETVTAAIMVVVVLTLMISTTTGFADSGGNNGQCIQLQKTFSPEIQDFQACHDTFTSPGHNEPSPLP